MLIVEPIYALHCCSILIFCGQSASKYVSRSENNDINHKNQASTTFTVKRRKSPFSFVQLIDNLLKSAFYTHYAVITWIFASTRKSIYLISVHNVSITINTEHRFIFNDVIFSIQDDTSWTINFGDNIVFSDFPFRIFISN